jgi:gliding motility-associatede transport system auxiliary component
MRIGRKILVVALLLVALGLVNYLASALPWRIDATAEHIYTLSPGTKTLLGKIGDPITLDLYFSKDTGGQFVEYLNYAARVREMLGQYVRAARGKIVLNVVDPEPDTPQEEAATAAGVQPQTLPNGGNQFYFGLVAIQGDQQKVIPALTPDRERFLEYDLSELIYGVQQAVKKKLGLITSLPLQGSAGMPTMGQPAQPSQVVVTEWQDTFDLVPVDATASSLPSDLDALAIVQPENLTPQLKYAIDQFLLSGKPVFIAVDPSSLYFREQAGQSAMFSGPPPNVSSDLPTLFSGWGLSYDPGKVVADLGEATEVENPDTGAIARYPDWLSLDASNFDPKALPTAELSRLNFMDAGSVALKAGSDLTFTPLVQSSAQAGDVDAATLQFASPDDIARAIKPTGAVTLAALVTGRFPTAFPDGPPKPGPSTGPDKDAAAPAPAAAQLKQSKTSSTLIVVADTDWLLDDYSVRKINFLGQTAAEPLNDNLAFAANSLDYLSGSPALISIRGKGDSLRPFTVVEKMEDAANAKYESKLADLENQLNDVQNKLSELQGKQTQGNRLVATPEVAKAIESFQKQEAELQGERRQIRLALRRGIDALENRVLLLNLLASPLLVCALGIWFYRARRKS